VALYKGYEIDYALIVRQEKSYPDQNHDADSNKKYLGSTRWLWLIRKIGVTLFSCCNFCFCLVELVVVQGFLDYKFFKLSLVLMAKLFRDFCNIWRISQVNLMNVHSHPRSLNYQFTFSTDNCMDSFTIYCFYHYIRARKET